MVVSGRTDSYYMVTWLLPTQSLRGDNLPRGRRGLFGMYFGSGVHPKAFGKPED